VLCWAEAQSFGPARARSSVSLTCVTSESPHLPRGVAVPAVLRQAPKKSLLVLALAKGRVLFN